MATEVQGKFSGETLHPVHLRSAFFLLCRTVRKAVWLSGITHKLCAPSSGASISPSEPGLAKDEFSITDRETKAEFEMTIFKDDELPDDMRHVLQYLHTFSPRIINWLNYFLSLFAWATGKV
jgi:hypothetical protein